MTDKINLKLTLEEAQKRAEELLAHENVQQLLRVQDGREKMAEYNVLVKQINALMEKKGTTASPE